MIAILDVSAAIQILLAKEKAAKFQNALNESQWVLSPDLYIAEISNVLWKYHRARVISHQDCVQYVEDGIALIDDYADAHDLWKEALAEGIKTDHSIYDMYYAVLARRNDATLITNDGDLAKICTKIGVAVCH